VAALALLSAAALGAAGRFDQYRTCEDCIAAGLGWSRTKQKCGGYQNKQCTGTIPDGRTRVCIVAPCGETSGLRQQPLA
jgi:hypothetical protein